jgi:pimeloyl-ACP methyl ester carboxylesterase
MASTFKIDQLAVEVAGGRLATFRIGASGKGIPSVLAVHGTTATSYEWLALARALTGRATIVAPDLRGRGASNGLPGPYGIQAHVADLIAVLDQLELEQPAVAIGHSLGAYIAVRLAADHPDRIRAAVLVDGGLTIPGSDRVDPQVLVDALLGPALARLRMTFASHDAYHDWWRAHPAVHGSDIADADLVAYADHDLVGQQPELRSSVAEQAVRGDAAGFLEVAGAADDLTVPSTLLCAPRGLQGEPNPMQPLALAEAWAAQAPQQRVAIQVPDVNHYTIVMGRAGAAAVAAAVAAALAR